MSVIRVGSNGTYAEGWDKVFGGTKGKAARKGGKKSAKKAGAKAAKKAKKPAAKKKPRKR